MSPPTRAPLSLALTLSLACSPEPDADTGEAETTSTSSATTTTQTSSSAADSRSTSSSEDAGTSESTSSQGPLPQAEDDVYYTLQSDDPLVVDAQAGLLSNDSGPDGESVVVVAADSVSVGGGTVDVDADGSLEYLPAPDFWGTDTFSYAIATADDRTDSASVTIHVAPSRVDLEQVVQGHGGFVIEGEADGDWAGMSVCGAGDFDGDGLADVLVNAALRGRAYLVHGRAETSPVELSAVAAQAGGSAIDDPSSYFGRAVDGVGDFNGDGLDDIVIGAPRSGQSTEGRVYVVYGRADGSMPTTAEIDGGSGGLAISGDDPTEEGLGTYVAAAGDVNGDGLADVIVGAGRLSAVWAPARAFVVFGRPGSDPVDLGGLAPTDGFAILPAEDPDPYWRPVASAGDVNGDGLADVLVASFSEGVDGLPDGALYVVFGKADGDEVALATLGDGGFSVRAPAASGQGFAFEASGIGDFDGDGLSDVAATWEDDVVVVFGRTEGGSLDVAQLEATSAGVFLGDAGGNEWMLRVAPAGDVNGDGLADLFAGPGFGGSRAYIVYGRPRRDSFPLASVLDGVGGFAIDGEPADEGDPGWGVDAAGDINGDGLPDIVVSNYAAPAGTLRGRAYVIFNVPRMLP